MVSKHLPPLRILLVDDDTDILKLLTVWLEDAGYDIRSVTDAERALAELPVYCPHLVITDLRMEGMDGLALFQRIQRRDPALPVIMLSGQAGIPDAVQATVAGVCFFLTKPVEREHLYRHVEQALRQAASLPMQAGADFGRDIVYRSPVMEQLMHQARRVAASDSTVFISGPTGSGKERLARAIHQASPRSKGPFVAINCAALPEQLLESELFGHEKGAFTGANARKIGLFQAANGGTLLLDEVGDMPAPLQVNLLRVLQESRVRPVGSVKEVAVDVRIISATHHDLEQAVEQGKFRQDLYYRLKILPLRLPPLAERAEDIPLLAGHFLRAEGAAGGVAEHLHFSPAAMDFLMSCPWPGNVRQLANVVEYCRVLSLTPVIPLELVKQAIQDMGDASQTMEEARNDFEHRYLVRVLRMANGNVTRAARFAGRNRTEFYRLLARHRLDAKAFRGDTEPGDRGAPAVRGSGNP